MRKIRRHRVEERVDQEKFNKGEVRKSLKMRVLVLIFKNKGDFQGCGNYRETVVVESSRS